MVVEGREERVVVVVYEEAGYPFGWGCTVADADGVARSLVPDGDHNARYAFGDLRKFFTATQDHSKSVNLLDLTLMGGNAPTVIRYMCPFYCIASG